MDAGFIKATSDNLPKVDVVMLGEFFATNTNFCSAEFRDIKPSVSSRASYGDDAVSYVQVKRDGKLCIMKCKLFPEHKVRSRLYTVTLIVDEEDNIIQSIKCSECVASQGLCKHAISFLMWVHRRSEEPASTSTESYWKKPKLSQVRTSLKYVTAKNMFKSSHPSLPSNSNVLMKFLEEGKKMKLQDCELFKYQHNSDSDTDTASISSSSER